MRIGIKLGSSLLTNNQGEINKALISKICFQVAKILKDGHEIFIVSSGAVASDPKKYRSKNLRSAIGQIKIIRYYSKIFASHKIETAQFLLTDRELLNNNAVTKKTLLEAFCEKVVPIINGNDTVDNEELRALEICADNDKLFYLTCLLVKADVAIIGFSQKGLLDNDKKIVHQVRTTEIKKILGYAKKGSALGHGNDGMKTKIEILNKIAKKGIRAILAPGKEKDFILRALANEKNFGTIFTL
jgi:glutamate 5-kinase